MMNFDEDAGNPSFEVLMDSILQKQFISKEEKQISILKSRLATAQKELHEQAELIAELEAARGK